MRIRAQRHGFDNATRALPFAELTCRKWFELKHTSPSLRRRIMDVG